jgi:hypothetical protein
VPWSLPWQSQIIVEGADRSVDLGSEQPGKGDLEGDVGLGEIDHLVEQGLEFGAADVFEIQGGVVTDLER